jgi:regulator of replication initiation timing
VSRAVSQINASLVWLVALPTVARWDWRLAVIITVFVAAGALALFLGLLASIEGFGLLLLRLNAAWNALRAERADLRRRLQATDTADAQLAQTLAAANDVLTRDNEDLASENERLRVENKALKARVGLRKEDRPS